MNFSFLCGLSPRMLTKISAAFLLDNRWYKISKEENTVFLTVKRLKHSLNQCSIICRGFAIGNLLDSDSKILFGRIVLKDLKYNAPFSNSKWVQAVDSCVSTSESFVKKTLAGFPRYRFFQHTMEVHIKTVIPMQGHELCNILSTENSKTGQENSCQDSYFQESFLGLKVLFLSQS